MVVEALERPKVRVLAAKADDCPEHRCADHATVFNQKMVKARMLNSISKFHLFNEFIWRSGYRGGGGYDYSAGVRYSPDNDLTLSIKGENLFDNTVENRYYLINPANVDDITNIDLPNIDRRCWISMEYLF